MSRQRVWTTSWWLTLWVLTSLTFAPSTVMAQASPDPAEQSQSDEPANAKSAFEAGIENYRDGNYSEAMRFFWRAYHLT